MVLMTTTFITTLFAQWIQQSVQRFLPEYRNNISIFNANLMALLFSILLVILLLAFILCPLKSIMGSYQGYYGISVMLVSTQFLYLTISTVAQSSFKSIAYKNISLINGLFKFIFPILLIYVVDRTINNLLLGIVLSQLLLIYPLMRISSFRIKDLILINFKNFTKFVYSIFSYGFPMIGWFLGNSVLNLCDRYVIQIFSSSKEVGIYSANYSIVFSTLSLLTSPLILAAQPILMNQSNIKENKEKIKKTISSFSTFFVIISMPMLSYVICFQHEISAFFLGGVYSEGSKVIPLLFGGIFLWNLALFGHKGFELLKETKIMFLFVLFCAFLNIILNLLLVPRFGYIGSSVATLISMGIYPLLVLIVSKRTILEWQLDWKSIYKIAVSSGVAGIFAIILKLFPFNGHYFIELFIGGLIGLFIYFYMIIKLKVVDVDIQEYINKFKFKQ
ncbi:hypothetical protein E4665_02420 [Sporolactobacillus shoreae]|uniref:Uncharacterized protein n=2 Tax=Sporolactobacillus shoreae TaxID=1465501 RepID=A0A4Z0GTD4_9BACL|nr:hypothetical protein E4665_02420 [Sporolactobacillus shoreae]